MQTRILIADDHPVLRSGLKTLISDEPDLVVVAEAGDSDRLFSAVAAFQPDVLILDSGSMDGGAAGRSAQPLPSPAE